MPKAITTIPASPLLDRNGRKLGDQPGAIRDEIAASEHFETPLCEDQMGLGERDGERARFRATDGQDMPPDNSSRRVSFRSAGPAAIAAPAAVSVDAVPDPVAALRSEPEHLAVADIGRVARLLITTIDRAATDSATGVDKLDRLIDMYERITAQVAKVAHTAALADMQQELPIIEERGRIDFADGEQPYTYALWEDINEVIKPILTKHGFALSFRTGRDGDLVAVTGVLSHRAGHSEQTTMLLPADSPPSGAGNTMNPIQAIGSATSYGKRYIAAALLNLTSRGADDDPGAAAIVRGGTCGDGQAITGAQRKALLQLARQVGADRQKLCHFFGIRRIGDLPARAFKKAENLLKAKGGTRVCGSAGDKVLPSAAA
jgi:ERF superfamily